MSLRESSTREKEMQCNEIRERMPEVAAGFGELTVDEGKHLESCAACATASTAFSSVPISSMSPNLSASGAV